jgi:excisionase family DNA binding protein
VTADVAMRPVLLRTKDAATYLGLSERRVRDLVEAGILHRRYIGVRQYRVTVASLDAYVESLPQEAPDA